MIRGCLCVILLGLLTACASSPQPRYYTLATPITSGESAANSKAPYKVAVGPVTLPEIVDRPHLVVRSGANQVVIAEQHRWAEPLKSELPHVIAANLSRELGGAWVTNSRQRASVDADYRVLIDVQRFDSVLGEAVTVEALWVIRASAGGEARRGRSLARESVNGSGYDALVAAHERALATISHDIADALRAVAGR